MIIAQDCPRVVFCVRGELTSEDVEFMCFYFVFVWFSVIKTKNNRKHNYVLQIYGADAQKTEEWRWEKNNLRTKHIWKFYVFVLSFKKDNSVLLGNEIKGS